MSRSGRIRLQNSNELASPISTETAQALTNMMIDVVENGTGKKRTTACCSRKTGTAEVGPEDNPHAWFIGFAPAEEPTPAIAVILEKCGDGWKQGCSWQEKFGEL